MISVLATLLLCAGVVITCASMTPPNWRLGAVGGILLGAFVKVLYL